jgi:hypothetical protein
LIPPVRVDRIQTVRLAGHARLMHTVADRWALLPAALLPE